MTIEAWDNAGNRSQRTTTVNVPDAGGALPSGPDAPIYARDHVNDRGQIPSTLGGEPFWASPDIIVLPAGASPGVDIPAPSPALVVGEDYDIYIRAHNPGCSTAAGAEARLWIATPGTVLENFRLLGQTAPTTVPAGGAALIGPITWTPTEADLDGAEEGHRCLVAKIGSQHEPLPPSDDPATFSVPYDDDIVQRNVQTNLLQFFVKNVDQSAGASQLQVELQGFGNGAEFRLLIARSAELDAAWDAACPALSSIDPVQCYRSGDWYVLQVNHALGVSPVWTLPGVSELDARVGFVMPMNRSGTATVTHTIDNAVVGGMVFNLIGPRSPR